MKRLICLACAASAIVTSATHAQVLVNRRSTLSYNYVFSGGTDVRSGEDSRTLTELMPNGDDNMDYAGQVDGTLPSGEPYSAGGNLHAHYHFDVAGFPNDIDMIHLDALVHAHSMQSGAGSSAIHVSNPGNEVELEFRVFSTIEFHLDGSMDSPFPVTQSYVMLQKRNGETWDTLASSLDSPEGRGPFNSHGTLTPGTYRMWSRLSADVEGEGPPTDIHCMYNLNLPGFGGCRADFNGDSIVDFFDYLDFVDAFAANAPSSDFNQDSIIDFFDYLDFVDAFAAGCG